MFKPGVSIAMVALAFVWTTSQAAEPGYSATYNRCMDRAGGVTASMIECTAAEYRRFDARLNAAYRIALGQRADRRGALTKAQRAWLAYKNANCAYYLDPDGGSAARIVANECALRMTAERALELETIATAGAP